MSTDRRFANIEASIGESLARPVEEYDAHELFRSARDRGVYEELCAILADHDRTGAARSTKREPLEILEELSCPVGVCTANARDAVDRALTEFSVREAVGCIVGRTSVLEHKHDPGPLLSCFDELDVRPGNAVFVRDAGEDAEAGERVGTSLLAAEQVRTR